MLEYIFKSLLCAGAAGTVLAVLMTLVKPITKKRFPAAWHYYMWIAVVVVMLAPARFNVSLPQIRFAPSDNAPVRVEQSAPVQALRETDVVASVETENEPVTPTQNEPKGFNFTFETAAWIWLIVMVGLFIGRLAKYWAFIIKLKRNSVAAECSELENYTKRKIPIRRSKDALSPLVVGFFKPCLILPDNDIDADRLGYILRHETTHFRRGDILWKWLATIAKCVHWFNPAIYFIADRINAECEISCDAAVTRNMSEIEKREYINTILSLLTTSKPAPLTTQMSGNAKRLAERFTMINTARRAGKRAAAVSSVLAVCVLGAAVFAGGVMADGVLGDNYAIEITNNGERITLENKPFVENNTVYLPLREMLNIEGITDITYNDNGYAEFFVYPPNMNVKLGAIRNRVQIGNSYAYIWGYSGGSTENAELISPPILKNDITYVPYDLFDKLKNSSQGLVFDGMNVAVNDGSSALAGTLYRNDSLNFKVTLPLDWAEKCRIIEHDNSVSVVQKSAYDKYGVGLLCNIEIVESHEADELLNMLGGSALLYRDENYAYIYTIPVDVQYPIWVDHDEADTALVTEYMAMFEEIDMVKDSFDLLARISSYYYNAVKHP